MADKAQTWVYTEDYVAESEALTAARAVAEDRLVIARELHDAVSGNLGAITVRCAVARRLETTPDGLRTALDDVETASREATEALRRMLAVLRDENMPPTPGALAAIPAGHAPAAGPVNSLAKALRELIDRARRTGVAAELDAVAWRDEFGVEHDRTALIAESNVFRYRPLIEPLNVRVGDNYALRDLLRLVLASRLTGTKIVISANELDAQLTELGALGARIRQVSDKAFANEIAHKPSCRVRTLGEVDSALYEAAVESSSVILDQDVLADGRRELLPFLLEQAVSTTNHRFGYIKGRSH